MTILFLHLIVPSQARSGKTIKVGVYQNTPLSFIEENGKVKGFFIDILEYIADQEGWEIEYIPCSFSECMSDLKRGEIDLLGVIAYSESRAKSFDYTLQSVITDWGQMYVNRETDIESIIDLEGRKVAVLHGDIYFDNLKKLVGQFGIKCRFIEAFEHEDVLNLVDIGRCEAGLVNQIYGIQNEGDYNLSKSLILVSPQKLYWAVPKGKSKELLYQIDRHLRKLKADDKSIYHKAINKWFSIGVESKFGKWFKVIVIGLIGILILFFATGLILRQQVKAKTKELRIKNEELLKEINSRKQVEAALRESEIKYSTLVENSKDGIIVISDGVLTFVNKASLELVDYSPEEIVGADFLNFVAPDYRDLVLKRYADRMAGKDVPSIYEIELLRKDGETVPVELNAIRIDFKDKPADLIFIRNITDRRQTEEALRESEEKYRTVLDGNPDPVIAYDIEGKVMYFNSAFVRVFGWTLDDRLGRKMDFFVPEEAWPETRMMIDKVLAGERFSNVETRRYTKEGEIIPVSISGAVYMGQDGNPLGSVINLRDVSEKKKLENQLHQAQKMESLGTLAGGIAHDFNNLLMGIQVRASLMLLDTGASHPYSEHLKGIEDYVKSAADLTKQLLGFARGGRYEVKPTDVNELIIKQNQMFGRTRKEINIQERFEKDLWTVDADQGQIEQVLLNIYVNAWQAMPGGGDLIVQTEKMEIDESFSKPYHVETGKYVRISVTDTGVGMDEATQRRIFDPFFTTKEIGRGTGLGLASAYGIIKNHGGFLEVYSEIGQGTTFKIYLPASEKEAVKEEKVHEEVIKGTERVLLVDDEDIILEVGSRILEKLGYEVLIAKNGKEAIEIYKENPDRIDMVILDMIMPGMGGGDTYDRLKEIGPDIKTLLSSGYSISGQATEILDRGCNGFIQKPFNMRDLSIKIREILDKS